MSCFRLARAKFLCFNFFLLSVGEYSGGGGSSLSSTGMKVEVRSEFCHQLCVQCVRLMPSFLHREEVCGTTSDFC